MENRSRVPILGDLPIFGRLFGGDRTTTEETEVLIFITPRIVGGGDKGRGGMRMAPARLRAARAAFARRSRRWPPPALGGPWKSAGPAPARAALAEALAMTLTPWEGFVGVGGEQFGPWPIRRVWPGWASTPCGRSTSAPRGAGRRRRPGGGVSRARHGAGSRPAGVLVGRRRRRRAAAVRLLRRLAPRRMRPSVSACGT